MEIDKKILEKYIKGEALLKEREEVLYWIEENKENETLFLSMKAQWVFDNLPNKPANESTHKEIKKRISPKLPIREIFIRVAALLLIPVSILLALLYFGNNKQLETVKARALTQIEIPVQTATQLKYFVNPGVKGYVLLPDSSQVWLNSNSQIECPAQFDSTFRMIELSGEAYFKVKSNREWPLYIKTSKGITVEVTGTEFNLSSYENDSDFIFTLVSGNVTLIRESTKQVIAVKPMEEIIIPENSKLSGKRAMANMELNTSWKEGYLVFMNTPMIEVIKKMERWYGVEFTISNRELLKYSFTANFQSESITQVLELLQITSNIGYLINEKNVTLFLK